MPRTDRHEVLHIMASDHARKPCAGTALRGHEMHTVPIRRDHEHGGPLGTIRLGVEGVLSGGVVGVELDD